jgi:hypothetical protein
VLTILRIVLWSPSSLNARCPSKTSSVGVPLAGDNSVRNGRSRGGYLYENTARHCSLFVCSILGLCCPQAGPDWLEKLHARPSRPGAPRLLLCDNHSSHDTYEFRKFCLDHDIHLFPLPGHATNILQPLDVVVFSPLDRYCSAAVDDWTPMLETQKSRRILVTLKWRAFKYCITVYSTRAYLGKKMAMPMQ